MEETVAVDEDNFCAREPLPKCRQCLALARPNILMFGDWSWLHYRTDEQQRRLTGLTPKERFANHKAGIKAASVVQRYGLRLLPDSTLT